MSGNDDHQAELRRQIRAISSDTKLSQAEKSRAIQVGRPAGAVPRRRCSDRRRASH